MTNPIPDVALEDNASQRLPCVLVLDGSGSMTDDSSGSSAIDQLNNGLRILEAELKEDRTARMRVRLLVLRLGGADDVEVVADWTDAIHFTAPTIVANGSTPLGKAVRRALLEIEDEKNRYDQAGIPFNRPWMFIMTDGVPTDDDWERAAEECRAAEAARKVTVFGIGTGTADMNALGRFSERSPKMLKDNNSFQEFFLWLSRSTAAGSKAELGAPTQMPATSDWATV